MMETSSFLRQIADNWLLLALSGGFLLAVFWAFRPGSRQIHRDSADIPFRHEDKPAPDPKADATQKEART
jgi:cytochrome c oxidase cbb3-type subunit 4